MEFGKKKEKKKFSDLPTLLIFQGSPETQVLSFFWPNLVSISFLINIGKEMSLPGFRRFLFFSFVGSTLIF